jgi:ribosomal protein S12
MTSYNMQYILYTCYCVLAVLEWHQQRMLRFWVSKDDTASSSSAVHHLQGAPVLKGVCYVSVIVEPQLPENAISLLTLKFSHHS